MNETQSPSPPEVSAEERIARLLERMLQQNQAHSQALSTALSELSRIQAGLREATGRVQELTAATLPIAADIAKAIRSYNRHTWRELLYPFLVLAFLVALATQFWLLPRLQEIELKTAYELGYNQAIQNAANASNKQMKRH